MPLLKIYVSSATELLCLVSTVTIDLESLQKFCRIIENEAPSEGTGFERMLQLVHQLIQSLGLKGSPVEPER